MSFYTMPRSLTFKLTLVFIFVSLIGIGLVYYFADQVTARQRERYDRVQQETRLANRIGNFYQDQQGWIGVAEIIEQERERRSGNRRPPSDRPQWARGKFFAVVDQGGHIVVPGIGFQPGEQVSEEIIDRGIAIEPDGQPIGTLITHASLSPENQRTFNQLFGPRPSSTFNSEERWALLYGALGATLISLLLGIILARTLIRPLRELTEATRAAADGDLDRQVPIRSQDELGELASSFNQMNAALAQARDLRRQMTADIAHDLRTPLSVIQMHAEGLADGVLPANQDTFEIILEEAQRLSHLVEDLRTLSLAEAGELPLRLESMSPRILIEQAVTAHAPSAEQKNIELAYDVVPDLPQVRVDPDRIARVFGNLISNALRYTPTNGQIRLWARQTLQEVNIGVQDNGPGIPIEDLPHVFDRFYRGDKSRQRQEGGSGLGLAIAKSLVEAHHGTIQVESQAGQGATFVINLPLYA